MNKSKLFIHLINFFLIIGFIFSDNKTITIQIMNQQNNIYFLTPSIGSNKEKIIFKIDLWSDMTWLMSIRCSECLNFTKYNESKSETYHNTNQSLQIDYPDSVDVFGIVSQDNFEISLLNSININFLLVTHATDYYESFSGVLGFGIPKSNNTQNSFIYQLKERNIISNLILGISLNSDNGEPKLTLGGYDKNIVKNTSEIKYCNALDNSQNNFTYWGCQMTSVKIGSQGFNFSRSVVFDSGIEDIKIPLKDMLIIQRYIFSNPKSNCQYGRDNYFHCTCDSIDRSNINNIEITLQNNMTLTISPKDFAYVQTQSTDNINCVLFISVTYQSDMWIIGNNYLNNFYTIFNYENRSIGFYNIEEQNDKENSMMILIITMIFVFSTCFFFIILLAIYKKCVNRNNRLQNPAYQNI